MPNFDLSDIGGTQESHDLSDLGGRLADAPTGQSAGILQSGLEGARAALGAVFPAQTDIGREAGRGMFLQPPSPGASGFGRFANTMGRDLPPALAGDAARIASLPYAAAAGALSGPAALPVGVGIESGAAALGAGAVRFLQQAGSAVASGGGTNLGDAARDVRNTALTQGLTSGVIGLGARALPYLVKPAAQVMRAMTGIPEKSGQAVLNDPSILTRALPVDEAGQAYQDATGGLKSGAEASRQVFGKSHFSGEAIADKFDELAPNISNGTIDTQTALTLRQRTMKAIEDLPFKQRELRRILANNIDELDTLLEKRLPEWAGARTGYRESKIAEEFSSMLPLNKNLSPNVLRTTAGIAAGAKGLLEGHPGMAVALPAISPRVWGLGIRAGAATADAIPTAINTFAQSRLPAGTYPIAQEYQRLRP